MKHLHAIYRDGLLNDTLPFWLPRAIDRECGGYFSAFDQDGTLLQTDKSVWIQGRFAWLLATLFDTVEQRPEWLVYSKHGIDFILKHCFDDDGRMFFRVTREGQPLHKRRYLFSEAFAVIALAAYGKASGEREFVNRAVALFKNILRWQADPQMAPAKINPDVRPMQGLAMPMILLVTAQELRKASADPACNEVIDRCIAGIERDFMRSEFKCVLETVGPQGRVYDTFEGRLVCPGHSLEAAWFILEEARLRNRDPRLVQLGATIVDWSLDLGWDREYGGLFYYRDAKGLPVSEYWHDMKFWWPHNEAIIAALSAWLMTGDARYQQWHKRLHDWTYAHFPDPQHGEWFGYLHRDGTLSNTIKGNMWKGPFHLPRMQWYCAQLLEEYEQRK